MIVHVPPAASQAAFEVISACSTEPIRQMWLSGAGLTAVQTPPMSSQRALLLSSGCATLSITQTYVGVEAMKKLLLNGIRKMKSRTMQLHLLLLRARCCVVSSAIG